MVLSAMTDPSVKSFAEVRNSFATSFSGLALSITAGATLAQSSVASQLRTSVIVARVKKSAVWALVGSNLALAVVGVVMFIWAVAAVASVGVSGKEVCRIRYRLSVTGVVEQLLDQPATGQGSREVCAGSTELVSQRAYPDSEEPPETSDKVRPDDGLLSATLPWTTIGGSRWFRHRLQNPDGLFFIQFIKGKNTQ